MLSKNKLRSFLETALADLLPATLDADEIADALVELLDEEGAFEANEDEED